MVCPYAERKGPIVICGVTGKKVNPLAYPCLTDKYEKCKYYRQAQEAKKPEKAMVEREAKPAAPPKPQLAPAPPAREASGPQGPGLGRIKARKRALARETKGLTLDGRKPTNCLECIYYGSKTQTCLLLGVEIKDPYDPPCART